MSDWPKTQKDLGEFFCAWLVILPVILLLGAINSWVVGI